jgi:hypothetical protein
MTYYDLYGKLHDQPFKPFRIKLVNNSVIDVFEPGMIILGQSSAVVPTETMRDDRGVRVAIDWKTISISHILEFKDIDAKGNGSKRKRS